MQENGKSTINNLCNDITVSSVYRHSRYLYKKDNKNIGRVFEKPSELLPDQTYTVRQLFERAVVNSMPVGAKPFYAEDTNDIDVLFNRSGIDLATLDLTELEEYKEMVNKRIEYHRNNLKEKDKPAEPISAVSED